MVGHASTDLAEARIEGGKGSVARDTGPLSLWAKLTAFKTRELRAAKVVSRLNKSERRFGNEK